MEMTVPGLQHRQWEEFYNDLESIYGGKIVWTELESAVHVDELKFTEDKALRLFEETGGPFEKLNKTSLTKVAADLDKTMDRLRTLDLEITMGDFNINASEGINITIDRVEERDTPAVPEPRGRKSRRAGGSQARREVESTPTPPVVVAPEPKTPTNQIRCFKCGRMNSPNYAFCMSCGKPLQGEVAPPYRSDRKIRTGLRVGNDPTQGDNVGALAGCFTTLTYMIIITFALMILLFITN